MLRVVLSSLVSYIQLSVNFVAAHCLGALRATPRDAATLPASELWTSHPEASDPSRESRPRPDFVPSASVGGTLTPAAQMIRGIEHADEG